MSSTLDNDPQEITPSEDSPAARNLGDELVGPFKVRQGKTLRWTNVNMTLKSQGPKNPEKSILRNVWGEARTETTAIMGPSGSGKTSLLNVLAGRSRTKASSRIEVSGTVKVDHQIVDPAQVSVRQHIAFVEQEDTLSISATPREAIFFSAKLRLSKTHTNEELTTLTNTMLRELGLETCADTVTGGQLLKGISGGERKRTSVGIELVTQPTIVFLDEPTSGLDSFSALQLVQVLRKVAAAGASVLFTIHQPQSDIFDLFDSLIIMNKGEIMYQGSAEGVTDHFEARGYALPRKYNPADYIMTVTQTVPVTDLRNAGFFKVSDQNMQESASSEQSASQHRVVSKSGRSAALVGTLTQIRYLMLRDFQALVRVKKILGARLALTTFMGVLTGFIFFACR